jgi:acyl-coenzyme A thioesterase PaaI-like protein
VSQDRRESQRLFMERWEAQQPPSSPAWAEKRRLAAAMRRVIGGLVESNAPEDELARAAESLESYAARLADHPRLRRGDRDTALPADPGVGTFADQSPFVGLANPLAPPMRLEEEDVAWRIVGRVRFGSAYEGPPGCVHGGYVAAIFDEVLGFVQGMSGNPGFTGSLTVRYQRPTPLHTELRAVGEITRVEGRKIFATGTLDAGELRCAEAEGLFITPHPEHYRKLQRARDAAMKRRR